MYSNTFWQDHVVDQNGQVIQQGTPLSARNLNNVENGIQDTHMAFRVFLHYFMQFERWIRQKVADFAAEFLNEIQTVTLTNSLTFPFNNSTQTVSLGTARKTLNYDVSWELISANGNVGDITVFDKQLNGFEIAFDGSATSVTLKLRIKGGMLV